MKVVQVIEDVEVFFEKLLALDETHADFTAFENKMIEDELYDFLDNIETLSCTGAYDSDLLSSIENLAKSEHLQKVVNYKRLGISDLSIDETHPDSGDVEELINSKSENEYEELRGNASPIIEELISKLEQLLFIDESLL